MSRYIDADALAKFIDFGHLRNPNEKAYSENDIREMIDMMPTIDLVRCKECKHSYGWTLVSEEEMFYHKVSKTRGFCKELKEHGELSIMVGEENFCCWGERRER